MSIYQWPEVDAEDSDDASGRGRFLSRRVENSEDFALRPAVERVRDQLAAPGPPGAAGAPDSRSRLWLPLGPATLVDGSTVGRQRVTGRVRDVWISPDASRVYAGSGLGGVWYSGDGGESWKSIGAFASSATDQPRPAHRFATGALLVLPDPTAPDDPARDVVFVGTGEQERHRMSKPGGKVAGVGVLVATGPATSNAVDPWSIEATELEGHGIYRLARDEDTDTIFAATSRGLRQRPASGDRDQWDDVDGEPFDDLTATCTDVLWTAANGGRPARLWVWVRRGDHFGLWYRDGSSGDFQLLATPGVERERSALAASTPPATVYLFNDQDEDGPPKLYRITGTGNAEPVVTEAEGVPDMVDNQGHYDLAIAVDPTDPDRVVLGGSSFDGLDAEGNEFKRNTGAIFTARVEDDGSGQLRYGGSGAPTFIGGGCHSDVHALRFTADGSQLWAASDGGVARSTNPTTTVGFVSRNDGISALESNYVASHPFCEGHVLAGQQDNGIMERRSSSVWYHARAGDGGGVAFDPSDPDRYVYQTHNTRWRASHHSDRFENLLTRGSGADGARHATRAAQESGHAAFYTNPAIIANVDPARGAQLIIPTNRVWYTEDWGANWVTLPTGTDPIGPGTYNRSQDRFGAAADEIVACAWATTDVAWILGRQRLQRLVRTADSWQDGSIGTWTMDPEPILRRGKKAKSDRVDIDIDHWSVLAPDPSVVPDPAADPVVKGGLYIGGLGPADDDDVDTLWWFDGIATWHPTGLRADPQGTEAPVTAVVCDPVPTETGHRVFVGTGVGVWEGIRVDGDDGPSWTWSALLNGLPESTVEDLSLYSSADPSDPASETVTLLRAAVAARGVWELRLDADVEDLTYLRAHADDMRYRPRAINVEPGGSTPRSWHGSPDIAIRQAPLALPAPASLQAGVWTRPRRPPFAEPEALQRFQAALRARMIRTDGDDRIEADGRWDGLFNEVLREFPGAEAADGTVQLSEAIWNQVVQGDDATAEPWGSGSPTEADIHDRTIRDDGEWSTMVGTMAKPGRKKVDVVVHHRGLDPRPGSDVAVTLLCWTRVKPGDPIPRWYDPSTWFDGDVPWTAAVNDVLNSADGTTSETFADGWEFVDPVEHRRVLTGQTLDNLTTGVVTFDLDLTNYIENTVMLLAAVVRAGDDIALTPDTLEEMARTRSEVAVRSMAIRG